MTGRRSFPGVAVAVALALLFAPTVYVRREALRPGPAQYLVHGSRDRTLHGKARRHARRQRPTTATKGTTR